MLTSSASKIPGKFEPQLLPLKTMAGVHSYDVTLRDEKYSLRQGRGPSYLESWRRSAKEPPVKEGKPLNMSTKRRNAQKEKSVQF